jgi:hypothetical protein
VGVLKTKPGKVLFSSDERFGMALKGIIDGHALASLPPGAQEAMAGVTTIMNAKLDALTYAVNCTIRRR